MKLTFTSVLFLAIVFPTVSHAAMDDGTALLFKEKGKYLLKTEQRQIFKLLDIKVAPDRKGLLDSTCEQDADFDIEVTDLNDDKISEVFVLGGNICNSGATGSSIWLFVKDSKGVFQANLGFPAAGYEVMKYKSKAYPDLLIGSTGSCSAVWRWNGTKYQYLRNVSTANGGCDGR